VEIQTCIVYHRLQHQSRVCLQIGKRHYLFPAKRIFVKDCTFNESLNANMILPGKTEV
jgi:hypothetical protein